MKASLLLIALIASCAFGVGVPASERDRYGGVTSLKGQATGWYHVAQIGGRWFFVTPEGHAFFSLGVTHTGETIKQDELGVFQSRFNGSREQMGESFLAHLRDWGFNSAGYGALETLESRIPYVATIWTEGPRSKSAGAKSQNTDIFDPQIQERLRGKVRAAATEHVNKPFCLGYVFMDLPIWNLKPEPGPNYVEFLRSLPEPLRCFWVEHASQTDGLPAVDLYSHWPQRKSLLRRNTIRLSSLRFPCYSITDKRRYPALFLDRRKTTGACHPDGCWAMRIVRVVSFCPIDQDGGWHDKSALLVQMDGWQCERVLVAHREDDDRSSESAGKC